jgi:hypothetical protein
VNWNWTVDGIEVPSSPGAMPRGVYDHGTVEAEGSGDALRLLLVNGPFWDLLDQDEPVTIELRPQP